MVRVVVPSASGTVIPARPTAALLGARGGGDTFVFSPQIAAGVTHQELAGIMPQMFERFAATVADKAARGGSYKLAFS